MRKCAAVLMMIVLLLPAMAAAGGVGRFYDIFEASYAENIIFLNENTGRLLLPHSFTRDYDADARRIYRIESGALTMEMRMDDTGATIVSLLLTLTAPTNLTSEGMAYSNFSASGYHCYALLMAMSDAATPYDRYGLVTQISNGLAAGGGKYETQVGDYRLACSKEGQTASFLFEHDLLLPKATPEPEADPAQTPETEEPQDEENDFLG